MKKMLSVIKIGGNVLDAPEALAQFLNDFAALPSPKILVHGGGMLATRLGEQLGIPSQMVDGRRITDRPTLDVVTMVYAGLVNKSVVVQLQSLGCDAVGLSGADGNVIPAKRREVKEVDYGYVGDIVPEEINTSFLKMLLDANNTPVFCALTHDGQGSMLNSNADSVASAIATAMSSLMPVRLVYCFELPGVLRDVNDESTVISKIDAESYDELRKQGIISRGMIPKIDNAFTALRNGVAEVVIRNAHHLTENAGTTCVISNS